MAEPQITQIASYVADLLPDEGVDREVTTQDWRHALRTAREEKDVEWLVDFLERRDPEDAKMQKYCADLRS
ncbi:MAG: hypothetical protein H6737_31485 [Alphaproteobacteria bacterium]|nr:hypothetical protein [Alphaproteobacteria bacterium]